MPDEIRTLEVGVIHCKLIPVLRSVCVCVACIMVRYKEQRLTVASGGAATVSLGSLVVRALLEFWSDLISFLKG
jgi:hypothetical protein